MPRGATCRLLGTRVDGHVKVASNGRLIARRARIDGNVQTQGHRSVLLFRGTVGGNVQLEQGRAAQVPRVRIDGNLQCRSNSRRPTGGRSVVDGNKEDRCRRL